MRLPSAHAGPSEQVRAWTTAFDAFAAAGGAAAAATAVHDLMAGTAHALAGLFADWVIVDLSASGRPSRSVAARNHQPELASSVARLPLADCPLIVSAMRRCTPLVQASMTDSAELGILPDGRRVADVLGAGSYAVSPITVGNAPVGAITVVRGRTQRPLTFLELSVLAHIADLAAAAIERLGGRERAQGT
jgi:GAF domain-containing protein